MLPLACQTLQVHAVAALHLRLGELKESGLVDEALFEGDCLRAADDAAGSLFDDTDVVRGVVERVDGAGVEPDVTVVEDGDGQLLLTEVLLVDRSDLEFAAFARLNVLSDLDDVVVVEVQSDDGVVRLRVLGLLFDRERLHLVIELYYTVPLRVGDLVGEYTSAVGVCARLERFAERLAVKEVVSQDQRDLVVTDEVLTDDEGLREAFRLGLFGVG